MSKGPESITAWLSPARFPFSGLAVAIIMLAFCAVLGLRVALAFTYWPDLGGVEPDELYTIQRVLAGYPVYENPVLPPFSITQKTPLYHYLCLLVGRLAGVNPGHPYEVMLLNRFVSLGLSLCTLLLAYRIQVRVLDTPARIALAASALAFICFEPHMFCRPDSLYSFLFLAAIGSFLAHLRWEGRGVGLYFYLAAGLSVLVVFAKQSGIVLPPLLLGYLAFAEKSRRKAAEGAVIMLGAFVFLFLLLKGQSAAIFIANTYKGLQNGIDLDWFHQFIFSQSYHRFGIAMAVGLFMAAVWLWIKPAGGLRRFLGWALLGTFFFANITGLKSGSTPSYFTEFVNLTLIAAPLFYRERGGASLHLKAFSFLLALLLLIANLSDKNLFAPFTQQDKGQFAAAAEARRYVKDELGLPEGAYILTDEPLIRLYFYENVLFPQYDIVYCYAYPLKVYDYSSFYGLVQEGKAPYLITSHTPAELEFFGLDTGNYHYFGAKAGYRIYKYTPQ